MLTLLITLTIASLVVNVVHYFAIAMCIKRIKALEGWASITGEAVAALLVEERERVANDVGRLMDDMRSTDVDNRAH